jgi:hypothetical protein
VAADWNVIVTLPEATYREARAVRLRKHAGGAPGRRNRGKGILRTFELVGAVAGEEHQRHMRFDDIDRSIASP